MRNFFNSMMLTLLALPILWVNSAAAVEIEYWQYTYASRVEAIDKLIEKFEAAKVFVDDLSETQVTNLAEYFVSLPSEIAMKLWTVLGDTDNINNVVALHKAETSDGTRVSDHLVEILGGNTED